MNLLSKKITPDFEAFRKCITKEKEPERVHFIEFYHDEPIKDSVCERFGLAESLNENDPFFRIKREIEIQSFLGYEMIYLKEFNLKFDLDCKNDNKDVKSSDHVANGPIQTWEDFEKYPWPDVSQMDFSILEWLEKNLPENMRCYSSIAVGMYKYLIGLEAMLYMMFDQPDLFQAVLEKLKELYVDLCNKLTQFSCYAVSWGADDMGFKTQTFLPPDFLRKYVLPVHKACAEASHKNGKLYFLHSCGQLKEIMDDIIDDVKIDAKHSFENAISPVTEMKKIYGDRIGLLGGVDVDFLCSSDEKTLRKGVREILETCMPGGGYCLGSGNSIAKYVPLENYLIMLDEGRHFSL
ncbi:MAG: hypothetical protein A2020_13895 [Lentisphaerae bacterium GWF2_45_14]|nr:MAG: hypothetical protein A2020_13895 [Lentisphaerae bacterium GWF2_45_14]